MREAIANHADVGLLGIHGEIRVNIVATHFVVNVYPAIPRNLMKTFMRKFVINAGIHIRLELTQ